MKKMLMLMLVLIVAVSAAGCVKPEESPLYKGGSDGTSENAVVPPSKYQAPEHWTDSCEKDDLSVVVDADVIVPDVSLFPTLVVIDEAGISQEMADSIRTTLFGDAVLNDDSLSSYLTKADIQQILDSYREVLAAPEDTTYIVAGTPEYENYISNIQEVIVYFEKLYEDARESETEPRVVVPADTKFHRDVHAWTHYENRGTAYDDLPMVVEGAATLNDGREALISITGESPWGGGGVAFYAKWTEIERSSSTLELDPMRYDVPLIDAGITMEQAGDEAISAIRAMGLDYLDIVYSEEQYIIEREAPTQLPSGMAIAIRPCYKFILTRNIGGIMENYAVARSIPLAEDQNYGYVGTERAEIIIAKEGILQFTWGDLINISATQNENVELLKFEDVQSVFNAQIIMDNIQSENDMLMEMYDLTVSSRKITITEARLGFMTVHWPDHEGEYLMIPVWDFYGYESLKLTNPDDARNKHFTVNEDGEYVADDIACKSFLTLNAVDGSVINRNLGY